MPLGEKFTPIPPWQLKLAYEELLAQDARLDNVLRGRNAYLELVAREQLKALDAER